MQVTRKERRPETLRYNTGFRFIRQKVNSVEKLREKLEYYEGVTTLWNTTDNNNKLVSIGKKPIDTEAKYNEFRLIVR